MARVDGKPKMVSERYLGSAKDIEKLLDAKEASVVPEKTRHLGFGDSAAASATSTPGLRSLQSCPSGSSRPCCRRSAGSNLKTRTNCSATRSQRLHSGRRVVMGGEPLRGGAAGQRYAHQGAGGAGRSGQFGNGQQDRRVLQCQQAVAGVGHLQQVTGPALPGFAAG